MKMIVLIRNSADGAVLKLSKCVYLLPTNCFYMKYRICCQKHKFIYLTNEYIIAEKPDPIDKNKLLL